MSDGVWPAGYGRVVLERVASTNLEAQRRLREGEGGPLWIAAREQTAGRGRSGRGWSTECGNFAASLLLPTPGIAAVRAATLAFVAGVAVTSMLREVAELDARLKWPNDVLVSGRKIAGVLLEGSSAPAALIVGIGVNLVHAPKSAADRLPATSVLAERGQGVAFEAVLDSLACHWQTWFARWENGFDAVREAWLERATWLGDPIEARLPNETARGRFAGIDEGGLLILRTAAGERRISAADVYAI